MRIILIILAILLMASPVLAEVKIITGATNIDDVMIRSNNADNNYGARTEFSVYSQAFYYQSLVRVKNVAAILGPNAVISSVVCSLYANFESNCTVYAYRVFKPWVEGTQNGTANEPGATWNDWDNDAWEWATAGCENADDGGSDNSGDGTGADRKATAEDNVLIETVNTWYPFDISTDLGQGWYDETIEEEGVLFKLTSSCDGVGFNSTEAGSNNPIFRFIYTAEGVAFEHSAGSYDLGTNWTNPGNATGDGDNSCAVYNNTGQDALVVHGFDFTDLETGDTIDSLNITFDGRGTGAVSAWRDIEVQLTKTGGGDNTPVGDLQEDVTLALGGSCPFSDNTNVFGNILWNTTWSVAEIEASTFGVIIKDDDTDARALGIDAVYVTVWYTTPGGEVTANYKRRRIGVNQ